MMQRQGDDADEAPELPIAAPTRPTRATTPPEISGPGRVVEFGREVRSELRQVAWPSRPEVANSSAVVILVLVLLVALIFALNYAFSHGVIDLLNVG